MDIAFLDCIEIMSCPTPFLASKRSQFIKISSHRSFATSVAVLALGAAIFFTENASGYTFEGPSWATTSVVMQLEMGNPGSPLSDGSTSWNAAVSPAVDMWNQVLGRIQLGRVMNSTAPIASGDRTNSMAFSSTVFGQSFGSNTLAVTYYSYSGSTMTEADILFNTRQQFDSYRGPLRFGSNGYAIADIQRVALHELGHVIGLAHPDQAGQHVDAVMNSVISDRYTLSSDDMAGGQHLYGAASPTATPTPTPAPTPTPTPTPNPTLVVSPAVSVTVAPSTVRSRRTATYTISTSIVSPTAAITVNYVMSGNAILGKHYTLSDSSGQITIPPGAISADVTLRALAARRRPKTATMILTPGAGYTLSASSSASVTIRR
jgi:hypothetical protein